MDQPMTRERILKQLGKTGNSPFSFTSLDLSVTGEVFMPVQALNELRRMGLEALERAILEEERPGADRVQAGADRVGSSIMEIKIPKVVQANKDLGTAKDPDPLPGRGSGSLLLTVSLEEQEQLALQAQNQTALYREQMYLDGVDAPVAYLLSVQTLLRKGRDGSGHPGAQRHGGAGSGGAGLAAAAGEGARQ